MPDIENIRAELAGKVHQAAAMTGLSRQTVRTIANGKNKNPTLATLRLLAAFLAVQS